MTRKECLDILEVPVGASRDEIVTAYRHLAQVWHPDRFPNNKELQQKAHVKLSKINEAYSTLIDGGATPDSPSPSPAPVPQPSKPSVVDFVRSGLCLVAVVLLNVWWHRPQSSAVTPKPSVPSPHGESASPDTVDPFPSSLPRVITSKSTGMTLTLIPAGEFKMGSSAADLSAIVQADSTFKEEDAKDEQPQHTVKISRSFYMGVYEVTQAEYESVTGTNPSDFSKSGRYSSGVSGMNTGRFPVETVSWFDAVEFCNKLSLKDGLEQQYNLTNVTRYGGGEIKSATVSVVSRAASAPGLSGYRLPTEAEWEYACRAGTTTLWHGGNTLASLNAVGWWGAYLTSAGNSEKRTNRVGQNTANAFGLCDMHGNVYEWCQDVYDENAYKGRSGTTTDPLVTSGSGFRVMRGGSWNFNASYTRTAHRREGSPDRSIGILGFRVVLSSPGISTP